MEIDSVGMDFRFLGESVVEVADEFIVVAVDFLKHAESVRPLPKGRRCVCAAPAARARCFQRHPARAPAD